MFGWNKHMAEWKYAYTCAGAGSIYKIWNHTPSRVYDRILILKTWFYKLWIIFESGNIFFTGLLRTSGAVIRQVKPSNYFTHHNLTSSARVIHLCCSTSVDDLATNEVIDMFDFLVFNNCWCVFDSMCLRQSFLPEYLQWKVGFAYEAVKLAFYFLRWMKTWPLVIRILVFLLWFSFLPRGSEVVIVPIIN